MNSFSGNGFVRPRPDKKSASNIKSIQRFIVNMTSSTLANVTISAVDLTKAVVNVKPMSGTQTADSSHFWMQGVLTTSTNLQITCAAASAGSRSIDVEVIEFNNVKSIQTITSSIVASSGSTSVTISSVNMNKTLLYYSWTNTNSSGFDNNCDIPSIIVTSSTSIQAHHWYANAYVTNFVCYVVEFN